MQVAQGRGLHLVERLDDGRGVAPGEESASAGGQVHPKVTEGLNRSEAFAQVGDLDDTVQCHLPRTVPPIPAARHLQRRPD